MRKEDVKLRAGKYRMPVTLIYDEGRIIVKFIYNKLLIAEIKTMEGAKYHGWDDSTKKYWSISDSQRNAFQLAYLKGQNPYARYETTPLEHDFERPLYAHQAEFTNFMLSNRQCIIAGEMGVGKSLSAIECMERSGIPGNEWYYVAPKSGLKAVSRELRIWKSKVFPRMLTYEGLTKLVKEWKDGDKAPRGLFLDESARAKNPTSQRAQACKIIADGIREDWSDDGFIILMSGAPAPKSPADWYFQAEIACPGFLKEGNLVKFKKRLAVVVLREAERAQGGYMHLKSWLDDEKKCAVCGEYQDNENHQISESDITMDDEGHHKYKSSKNEVAYLYERMKGLVLVKFKKDCLDLPDKQYRKIVLEPTQKTINLARAFMAKATTVIGGITLLRELSDGFQYREEVKDKIICNVCRGSGNIDDPLDGAARVVCDVCGGEGWKTRYKRVAEQITCPKEAALCELLDEMGEIGRIVIYAGFTGSVDRCVQICQSSGWGTVRVDGRGWNTSSDLEGDPLDIFQDELEKYPRVAFIGQPQAAGIGLTLTASPMIVYYSNDFNFENRVQSEDRIHRPGMDLNRGATIVDLLHLPTDQLVLDNLKKKKRLQALTMGDLSEVLK